MGMFRLFFIDEDFSDVLLEACEYESIAFPYDFVGRWNADGLRREFSLYKQNIYAVEGF